jgi:hypothetical protein
MSSDRDRLGMICPRMLALLWVCDRVINVFVVSINPSEALLDAFAIDSGEAMTIEVGLFNLAIGSGAPDKCHLGAES